MEINNILAELYALDPSLKEHESSLISLISQMSDLKPDTKFDKKFAARLKKQLFQEEKVSKINFNFMNKRLYFALSSVALVAVVILLVQINAQKSGDGNYQQMLGTINDSQDNAIDSGVVKLVAGAYGSLGSANSNFSVDAIASEQTAKSVAPLGMGGGRNEAATTGAADMPTNSLVSPSAVAVSRMVDPAISSKMIMPPAFSFKYVYKGEPLELKEENGDVYRRIKGDGQMGKNLVSLLDDQNLGQVNLKAFNNLRMTNLSLLEDRDLGLMLNFDFNEDSVYISENWEKWRIQERESCTDEACFNRFRLKMEDVPADDSVIAWANDFLSTYGISLEHYGEPSVENNWKQDYEKSADKNNYYIPEYVTVVYPLMIDGQPARDQGGNYTGLRVTINLMRKAASGLNGLMPYRYESSSYALETDADSVLKVVENGGWNRMYYYMTATETREIELGTPSRTLVQTWKYNGGKNEELLVPALVFPVLNSPSEYYGSKFVTVPLVKEMLGELKGSVTPGGGAEPVPMPGVMYR